MRRRVVIALVAVLGLVGVLSFQKGPGRSLGSVNSRTALWIWAASGMSNCTTAPKRRQMALSRISG